MNKGKICVSVCAETADEMLNVVRQAAPLADVIEIRFDCLRSQDLQKGLPDVPDDVTYLITYRPRSQGGFAEDDQNHRAMFWVHSPRRIGVGVDRLWFDNEYDFGDTLQWTGDFFVVKSFHDFDGVPEDLGNIYDELSNASGAVKIAVSASDVPDAIPLWKLLERSKADAKPFIPIAMGEAGKWTRILGMAHGALMTFAAPDSGSETAPGQISVRDMLDVFRVKDLGRDTKVHGIIAGDTSYSVSPWMHNAGFEAAGLDRVFVPLQVADLNGFIGRMVRPETREIDLNFAGFSVTNPHKQAIMRHLDEVDETASKIGAVNTVKIEDGKLYGYNTDAPGFMSPLRSAFGDLKDARIAVAGAGGAARACVYALQQEGANVTLFARDTEKAKPLSDEFDVAIKELRAMNDGQATNFGGFDILVNATPLGTAGENVDSTVATADQLKDVKLVYDLIYNPAETRLIHEANKAGIKAIGGLEMLIAQGAKQFEIWTGDEAPVAEMRAAVTKKLNL